MSVHREMMAFISQAIIGIKSIEDFHYTLGAIDLAQASGEVSEELITGFRKLAKQQLDAVRKKG